MARAWIGCSGWTYDHWVGVLYPEGLVRRRWRDAYAAEFDTVELNASFYRWPGVRPFRTWGEALPDGFRMAVKASRWLTHGHRLDDPDGAWAGRLTAAWEALGDRRGPVLLQLPDELACDDTLLGRLDELLGRLPGAMRVAVEGRHPSWHNERAWSLLERRGAAYVVTSGAHLPCHLRATADVVYVRLHGPDHEHLYAGSQGASPDPWRRIRQRSGDTPHSDADLHWWADRVREWLGQGREVYAYFNNDGHDPAVRNARTLRSPLG